jgi:hypothetical protein
MNYKEIYMVKLKYIFLAVFILIEKIFLKR